MAERLKRRWICCELVEDYLKGALGRFERRETLFPEIGKSKDIHYKLYHPSAMWNGLDDEHLSLDGGRSRKNSKVVSYPAMEAAQPVIVRERVEKSKRFRAAQSAKNRVARRLRGKRCRQ